MIHFDVLTLFPAMFDGFASTSIVKRAQEAGHLVLRCSDLRSFAQDRHRTVDDTPYGGGGGMVMKPEPLYAALQEARAGREVPLVFFTPQGRTLTQAKVRAMAKEPRWILLCGHYEGVDERIVKLATEEISLGDYVLTGGELPAMVLIDAMIRCIPGVLGAATAAEEDSFGEDGLLEYPHYTRPAVFRGEAVPEVLRSGDHQQVKRWRRAQSLLRTLQRRPELLRRTALAAEDHQFLRTVLYGRRIGSQGEKREED